MKRETIKAAYQTWYNGSKRQISPLYLGERAEEFVENHRQSRTFANLHTFEKEDEGKRAYYSEDVD